MKVSIRNKGDRYQLSCYRPDGSITTGDVGPTLPCHDLAHFVAETHFEIREGFYGNVLGGRSVAQLNDEQVIRSLGADAWRSEVLARAITSLHSGACDSEHCQTLVNTELAAMGIAPMETLSARVARELLESFQGHLARFEAMGEGGSLELDFRVPS
ncbi:MAG: hypothetical protein AAF513_01085 [Pseudomonadota bacterium]